jgi:hypothetical protein
MVTSLSQLIEGPEFAASVDLVDAIRQDPGARPQLENLLSYLFDATSGNDAQSGALAAVADMLQVLDDDTDFTNLEQLLAQAMKAPLVGSQGNVVRRGLADAGVRMMSRIMQQSILGTGAQACTQDRDPNHALATIMANMVTPMTNGLTPLEVIADAVADVNRAVPQVTTKLTGPDYGNIGDELSQFMLDPSRGLEQFYTVIKQATQQ